MSKQTLLWLNTMSLIGFTSKRGNAWHYKEELQGDQSNHYEGPIPQEDVLKRLFNFTVSDAPIFIKVPCDIDNPEMIGLGPDNRPYKLKELINRKAMVTDDTYDELGIFKGGYQGHTFREWLLQNVANILGDGLSISSAGLLRNRAVAWVEVSVPDNIRTPEGVVFRPNLVACTSYDGSLSTTYKRNITNVVCDNTLRIGIMGDDQRIKIKHSANSLGRMDEVRSALGIVVDVAEQFQAEVSRLCSQEITLKQWGQFLDLYVPMKDKDGNLKTGRGLTNVQNKREALKNLYNNDLRVSPWAGTAFGVLQATNTYNAHIQTVRGGGDMDAGVFRGLRNMENALMGVTEKADAEVLVLIDQLVAA